MAKCPNCGRKAYGDSCQWCNYPLIRHTFPWQAKRGKPLEKLIEEKQWAELKVEQIINEAREKAKKEAEKQSARIIAESKQRAEQIAEEIKKEAKRKAEQIVKESKQKVKKEAEEELTMATVEVEEAAEEELTMATVEVEEAAEEIAEPTPLTEVTSVGLEEHPLKVAEKERVTDKIKVFLIDDQDLFRHGLRLLISQTDDIELIGESDFLEYTVAIIEELVPDLVLIDINLPWLSGLGLAQRISQCSPDISVIILSSYEDDNQIFEAVKAGVAGYLSKSIAPEGFTSAIRRVFKGENVIDELLVRPRVAQRVLKQLQGMEKENLIKPLSPQETEILGYFANGYLRTQVARIMDMSEQQITNYMASIVSKNLSPTGTPDSNST